MVGQVLPEDAVYRTSVERITNYRLKVVLGNEDVRTLVLLSLAFDPLRHSRNMLIRMDHRST